MGINSQTTIVGKLPTGGSGGGPNKNLYPSPEPQAVLGLNSTVVYGANVSVACPINFQMALGSNVQLCINPNAWQTLYMNEAVPLPPLLSRILGSGLGGNMQLTMGTSANFVMGQIFDINLGPRRITLDVHTPDGVHKCGRIVGTVMMAAAAVFLVAYAATEEDDWRAVFVGIFATLMQVLLMVIMDTQHIYGALDGVFKKAIDTAFSTDPSDSDHYTPGAFSSTFTGTSALGGALIATALAVAAFTPVLLSIIGEVKLDNPPPPETETYKVEGPEGDETVTIPKPS